MNGMQFVNLRKLLLVLFLISTVLLQSKSTPQTTKGPGISACYYWGFSNGSRLPVEKLPKECTSFLFDGIYADPKNNVYYGYTEKVKEGDLDLLLKAGKPVYSYYGHGDAQQWSYVLGCGATNAHGTMKALKVYMDAHPGIKGLIFNNLEYTDTSKEYPKYTENLMAYIKLMRESFSNLEIGLLILGNPMMKQFENPKRKWLDIKVLEPSVDFFVVSVTRLNNCTLESRVDSMAPISGNRGYTMTKLQELLGKNGFPDKKVYYSIALNPTSNVTTLFQSWNTTYQEACTHQKNAGKFCVEKTSTYYQKGEFVKKHAAGFIGSCVDFSDPDNKCGCDRPFAPFYDVLDGFNGKPAPKECSILDKL